MLTDTEGQLNENRKDGYTLKARQFSHKCPATDSSATCPSGLKRKEQNNAFK